MTGAIAHWLAASLPALAAGALVILLARTAAVLRRSERCAPELPGWIRSVWWPALLLRPILSRAVPPAAHARNSKLLASLTSTQFSTRCGSHAFVSTACRDRFLIIAPSVAELMITCTTFASLLHGLVWLRGPTTTRCPHRP